MDLKDKLKYYKTEKKQILLDRKHHLAEIATSLAGNILENETLPIIKIERFEPYSHIFPTISNQIITSVNLRLLTKNQFLDPISLTDFLVFDLETTGLAGGTGTYPFLMGFGLFEKNGFRIFQYFLPEFGREISAYLDLKKIWSNRNIFLTYNGKSFDYPLLRNRLILNRVDNPFENYKHLDLLHLTRRLWKQDLPSCSLQSIEEHIFSFHRWRDIDGSLIPQAYFTYLHTGDTSEIKRIIDHNQLDIISLARLLLYLDQIENYEMSPQLPDRDMISLFNIAVNISDLSRIKPIMNSMTSDNKKLPNKSLKRYSLLLKRRNNWLEAVEVWKKFIEKGEEIIFSCEELAKYYEHREKDIDMAITYTNRAIEFLNIVEEIQIEMNQNMKSRFDHRQNRLYEKLKKKN